MKEAREPNLIKHRARPAAKKEEDTSMESYRSQIIAMLDTVNSAALMRTIYEVVKALLMHR